LVFKGEEVTLLIIVYVCFTKGVSIKHTFDHSQKCVYLARYYCARQTHCFIREYMTLIFDLKIYGLKIHGQKLHPKSTTQIYSLKIHPNYKA
jgi:hypothetical protein